MSIFRLHRNNYTILIILFLKIENSIACVLLLHVPIKSVKLKEYNYNLLWSQKCTSFFKNNFNMAAWKSTMTCSHTQCCNTAAVLRNILD